MISPRFFSVLAFVALPAVFFPGSVARADLPPGLAAPRDANTPRTDAPVLPMPKPKQRPQIDTARADQELRQIVTDQQAIFAAAEAASDKFDPDNFRSQMQQLTQRYDRLLLINPNYVPGCVAYGLLLAKIGMAREGAAFMYKANELDDKLPVVKNQLGNFCAEEGRPLEAYIFYNAAIALDSREPLYYHQLGTLLAEARDIFLKEAPDMWSRSKIDEAMQAAFLQATELAPGDWRHAYRYGLSFYDLQTGEWEAALQFWETFETKLKSGVEQQVCRLHQARVFGELRRIKDAQARLDSVTASALTSQKMPIALEIDALRKKGVADQSDAVKDDAVKEELSAPDTTSETAAAAAVAVVASTPVAAATDSATQPLDGNEKAK
jgi:tetratricopeptide (TPR) repeat protein